MDRTHISVEFAPYVKNQLSSKWLLLTIFKQLILLERVSTAYKRP